MKKIALIAGARPNFMKIAPLARELLRYPSAFDVRLVHTGQHYDANMSSIFFLELGIPQPHACFDVGSGTHAEQTAKVMVKFEAFCAEQQPDLVIVVGDVNSTLACAIVAKKLKIRLAHVEAGLRSFDRAMPEEINRLATDAISDMLFVTEKSGMENLRREGHPEANLHFVGNLMIDTLRQNLEAIKDRPPPFRRDRYALVTLHRPSNVDAPDALKAVSGILREIADSIPVIFPAHPRTQKNIRDSGLEALYRSDGDSGILICDPLGYLDFLNLTRRAAFCLTDSGGIQEETTVLGVPCLTLRENTERPATVTEGTNTLVGLDRGQILSHVRAIMNGSYKKGRIPELWDGKAAPRIREILQNNL